MSSFMSGSVRTGRKNIIFQYERAVILGLILGLRPANERRRYLVSTSLIGWAPRIIPDPCGWRDDGGGGGGGGWGLVEVAVVVVVVV